MGTSEIQGNLWGAEAQGWAKLFEPMSSPLWLSMLDATQVQENTRFLDLGCGGGGASVLANKRGAKVTGLDAAPPLIKIASRRLPKAQFFVGDMEALPFDNDCFDVSFASLSIMFTSNPNRAIAEMKRVTSPGGFIAVGIWGKPEDCDYRYVLKAIVDTLPCPSEGNGPFALSQDEVLESIFRNAGLDKLQSAEVSAPFEFENFDIMWCAVNSVGPVQAARQRVSEERLKTAVCQASKPFVQASGSILFQNRLRHVTAKV